MEPSMLSNLLSLFGNMFRIYLIYLFLKAFLPTEGTKAQMRFRFGFYLLFFIGNSLGFLYFQWNAAAILISNLAGVFLITLSYSGKWKYRICAAIAIVTVNVICEDFIYAWMMQLHIKHLDLITIAITNLLLLMIVLLFRRISDFRQGEEVSILEWIAVTLVPVISMAISVVTLDKCEDQIAIAVGGIGLLSLNVFVFYLFHHVTEMYRSQTQMMAVDAQNHAYRKQLELLSQSEEKVAAFRHDLNNHIAALGHLAKAGANEELGNYLQSMSRSIQPQGQFASTGDALIDGMLNLKLGEAANRIKAEVHCQVQLIDDLTADKMDVSILLGNLLDNAIRALGHCSSPGKLDFTMEKKRGILRIWIKNSHNEKLKEWDGLFVTTKKDKKNHGIGLKNVERIVEKYHGEMQIDHDDQWFSVKIILFL